MTYPFKPGPDSSHALILAAAGLGHGRRLLDVGAGDGHLAVLLRRQGWIVTTLDSVGNPDVLCDLSYMPLAYGVLVRNGGKPDREPFDTIVCGDVLEHLVYPDSVLRYLKSLLLIEGRVIVSVPNVAHLWARWQLLRGRWPRDPCGIFDQTHLHWFTEDSARAMLAEAGLRVVKMTATPPPIGPRIQRWLAWRWPRLFGYQFVFVADLRRGVARPPVVARDLTLSSKEA